MLQAGVYFLERRRLVGSPSLITPCFWQSAMERVPPIRRYFELSASPVVYDRGDQMLTASPIPNAVDLPLIDGHEDRSFADGPGAKYGHRD